MSVVVPFRRPAPSATGFHLSHTEPFDSAEHAWFWFIQTFEAIHSGARLRKGFGAAERPCEAADIQNLVTRLHRSHTLSDAHLEILVFYGQRQIRPSGRQPRHAVLWHQAMQRLTPPLRRKGIIR